MGSNSRHLTIQCPDPNGLNLKGSGVDHYHWPACCYTRGIGQLTDKSSSVMWCILNVIYLGKKVLVAFKNIHANSPTKCLAQLYKIYKQLTYMTRSIVIPYGSVHVWPVGWLFKICVAHGLSTLFVVLTKKLGHTFTTGLLCAVLGPLVNGRIIHPPSYDVAYLCFKGF